jgi:hypothetical protein
MMKREINSEKEVKRRHLFVMLSSRMGCCGGEWTEKSFKFQVYAVWDQLYDLKNSLFFDEMILKSQEYLIVWKNILKMSTNFLFSIKQDMCRWFFSGLFWISSNRMISRFCSFKISSNMLQNIWIEHTFQGKKNSWHMCHQTSCTQRSFIISEVCLL